MYSIKVDEEKIKYQALIFSHRLQKKFAHLKKWAKRSGIVSYRVYDRDIKEVPLALDLYELADEDFFQDGNKCVQKKIFESESQPKENAGEKTQRSTESFIRERYALLYVYGEKSFEWISSMKKAIAETLSLRDETHIIEKKRIRTKGGSQYAGMQTSNEIKGVTSEYGKFFFVHLTRAIDTGLFLDARLLRCEIEKCAFQKRVLNLFCYTAAFSVYAASGGAREIDSIDLSNTYIKTAKKNMRLNGFCDFKKYRFIKADCQTFLENLSCPPYDIIILDPPTFSNSKMTKTVLSIYDDWKKLISLCLVHLKKDGALYFSTNAKHFHPDEQFLKEKKIRAFDLTRRTTSEDYKSKTAHRAWKIVFA